MNDMCDCVSEFSIEPHGENQVLYFGRCPHKHGYNLTTLSEPAFNCDFGHLQYLLNLGIAQHKRK